MSSFDDLCRAKASAVESAKRERERSVAQARELMQRAEAEFTRAAAEAEAELTREIDSRKAELCAQIAAALDPLAAEFVVEDTRAIASKMLEAWRSVQASARELTGEEASPSHVAYAIGAAKHPDALDRLGHVGLWEDIAGVLRACDVFNQSQDGAAARAALLAIEAALSANITRAAPEPGVFELRRRCLSHGDTVQTIERRQRELEETRLKELVIRQNAGIEAARAAGTPFAHGLPLTNVTNPDVSLMTRMRDAADRAVAALRRE